MFRALTHVGTKNFVLWLELFSVFQQFIGVIIGAILSGLIAFVVNILIEKKKRRKEKREKHLQE
jgi:predicted membrane protein